MLNNQVKGKIIEYVHEWHDHTIMAWDYEGIYFLSQEEGGYDVDISRLLENFLYKNITLIEYLNQ
jgi:hypothetical protein